MTPALHSRRPVAAGWQAWRLCALGALSACGGGGDDMLAPNGSPPDATATANPNANANANATANASGSAIAMAAGRPMSPSAVASTDTKTLGPAQRVSYSNGALNVHVRQGDLRAVLTEIGKQAGITIIVAPSIASASVAGELNGASLADGLLRLLRGYDVLLAFQGSDRSQPSLQTVWVTARGEGHRTALPMAQAQLALRAGVSTAIGSQGADAPATESAAARDLQSPDASTRHRALSHAVDMQYALPEDTLRQLAGADADPALRLLALAALGRTPAVNSPNARAAAQSALRDNDAAVRDHAKDMLEQLDMAAIPSDLVPQTSASPPMP